MSHESLLVARLVRLISLLLALLYILYSPATLGQASGSQSNSTLFLPAVTYNAGGFEPYSIALADMNNDGKLDSVVVNVCANNSIGNCTVHGSVGVLLGNGDSTFSVAFTYDSGGYLARSVAVADVNHDGKRDVVVVNGGSNALGVLLGNGDGTFQPAVSYGSGGPNPLSAAVADVSGDGKADLLVVNGCPSNCTSAVGVLLGRGDGTFNPAVTYSSGGVYPMAVAVAEMNVDGRPDLLVANGCGNTCAEGAVAVLLGNGDGSFRPATQQVSGGRYPDSVAIGDVNGDKILDAVVANSWSNTVGVLLGNGDGKLRPPAVYNSGGLSALKKIAAEVADVNGDGKLDLLVVSECPISGCLDQAVVGVLLGNGDGTFLTALTFDSGGYMADWLAVGDVNGDGAPDVVVANKCSTNFNCEGTGEAPGSVGVLLNNTAPDISPPTILVSATPRLLRPPNGAMVPVVVSGRINDTGSGIKSGSAGYAVRDQYHLIQPQGTISLDTSGNYSFTILLRASLESGEANPHQYTIRITAFDNVGNRAVKWVRVTVPRN